MSHRRQSFCFILSLPLLLSRGPCHARETDENRPQLSPALTAPRLQALQRAEDIGSALKGGVNVCQRQVVNEMLGPPVTEFVRNFSREDATPYQHGTNASLLGRVQAIKIIRHTACRHLSAAPHRVSRLLRAPGSKWCLQTPPAACYEVASVAVHRISARPAVGPPIDGSDLATTARGAS